MDEQLIPIEISARHIHLSKEDVERLFGAGYELKKLKHLTQPSDFAAEETLAIQIDSKKIPNVRIVGPTRKNTQIELSMTDAISLGVMPPVRISGDIEGTPGAVLIGPKGEIKIEKGMIIAQRHLHCQPKDAKKFGLKKGDFVSVKCGAERGVIFENITTRIGKDYQLSLHLDTDEGNAAGIGRRAEGNLIMPGSKAKKAKKSK